MGPADEIIGRRRPVDPASLRFHEAIATIFGSDQHPDLDQAAETIQVIAMKVRCMNLDQAQTIAMLEIIAEQARRR